MIRGRLYALHVVAPLLVGGMTYILWRTEDLLMFRWFEAVHVDGLVERMRGVGGGQHAQLPAWFLYSLPDAAWVYSFAMYTGLLWINSRPRLAFGLAAFGPALGLGGELGQAIGLVPGTFDFTDLILSVAAAISAVLALETIRRMKR